MPPATRFILPLIVLLGAVLPAIEAMADAESMTAAFARYKALRDMGRYQEAQPFAREALTHGEQIYADNDPQLAQLHGNLAELEDRLGRPEEAAAHYRRALEILEASAAPDARLQAVTLSNLAQLARSQGRPSEALPLAQRAIEIFQGLEAGKADLAIAQTNLAAVYLDLGRGAEAKPLLQQALLSREAAFGADDPVVLDIRKSLAALEAGPARTSTEAQARQRQLLGRYREAEVLYRQALAEREAAQGPSHPDLTPALRALADLLTARAAYAESEALLRRALTILVEHPEARPQGRTLVVRSLARLLERTGRRTEAERLRAQHL